MRLRYWMPPRYSSRHHCRRSIHRCSRPRSTHPSSRCSIRCSRRPRRRCRCSNRRRRLLREKCRHAPTALWTCSRSCTSGPRDSCCRRSTRSRSRFLLRSPRSSLPRSPRRPSRACTRLPKRLPRRWGLWRTFPRSWRHCWSMRRASPLRAEEGWPQAGRYDGRPWLLRRAFVTSTRRTRRTTSRLDHLHRIMAAHAKR